MQPSPASSVAARRSTRPVVSSPHRCSRSAASPPVVPSPRACMRTPPMPSPLSMRSEEHTSELQSQSNLVCRLLLEKKKTQVIDYFLLPLANEYVDPSPTADL